MEVQAVIRIGCNSLSKDGQIGEKISDDTNALYILKDVERMKKKEGAGRRDGRGKYS